MDFIIFFIQFDNFKEIFIQNDLKIYNILTPPFLNQNFEEKLNVILQSHQKNIDYPDEFCDPLLFTEIKVPVIIPETDIFMDKNIIENYLGDYLINPFSRNPLTIKQLQDYNSKPDIKIKIIDFKHKKEKWKNENI